MNAYIFECQECDVGITVETSAAAILPKMDCPVCIWFAMLVEKEKAAEEATE